MRNVRSMLTRAIIAACVAGVAACADTNEAAQASGDAAADARTGEARTGDASGDAGGAQPAATVSVTFDTATVTFTSAAEPVAMKVEVADRADRRAYGLMDRSDLDPNAGMIFLYDQMQGGDSGFWMYRTRIPLDIAYFDSAGRIVAIRQMMPCTSLDPAQCPGYSAGVPFFGAIEANRGYFARHGIGVGDSIVLPGRIGG